MRFSACLRLARSLGFFWGTTFIAYGTLLAGRKGSMGYRKFWRWFIFSLAEGAFLAGGGRQLIKPRVRLQSLGRALLFFYPAHIPVSYPWAWFILRQLKLRTYRSIRYRLGLPSRGQRTRTNAATVARHSDSAVTLLHKVYWRRRLWQTRSATKNQPTKMSKGTKSKQKAAKKKGPVARSKDKKKSVWR